jgi:hypothetical protein
MTVLQNRAHTIQFLGYQPDARLLIPNAGDFGMCYSINPGILRALQAVWRES